MNNHSDNAFTNGKILSPLLKFTLPILFALVLQAMYGAVDLLVVGQFGDAASISAVSTGSTIIHTATVIVSGFTMGATVLIGKYIGSGDRDLAGKAVGASICLFSVMALVMTAGLLILAKPFARILNAPAEALDKTILYTVICTSGMVFVIAYNVISGIFRGIGNSKLPLIFVAIACLVNIAGDLLLTGLFKMDVAGVAIATIAAQAVSVVISIVIIRRQELPFRFKIEYLRFPKEQIKSIILLGSPIALQDVLTNISFLVVNSLVNGMGLIYSAGYGVAQKEISFILLMPSAFMQAVSAFVAQNMGANQRGRAKKATFYGMATAVGIGIFMFVLGFFYGDVLSRIFSSDPDVIAQSADYLKGFSLDCIMTSILFCFIGYFNGCGKTSFVMIQGLCGAFLVRIPLSYLFSRGENVTLFQMGIATPLASLASIILCVLYYLYLERNPVYQNNTVNTTV